ncbi:MAG: TPM domain-containing protein, partial [Deltaproteobacteria bacterium]|nr:TPM domain-containing protein [Deltaproteobacteria bacterium]
SPENKQQLESALRDFELTSTNQIVVATFTSLEGGSLEDFTVRAAEKWKVGQKANNNGVILFIFVQEHEIRIEVGYGLEGALPDATSELIIQQEIVPYFRAGNYDEGVRHGVVAIMKAIAGEYTATEEPRYEKTAAQREALRRMWGQIIRMALIAMLALSILDFFRYRRYRSGHKTYPERYGFGEWWFRFAILFIVISVIFRILYYLALTGGGGYHGSRSGSGGFSGGGGSFGGGGASGRW